MIGRERRYWTQAFCNTKICFRGRMGGCPYWSGLWATWSAIDTLHDAARPHILPISGRTMQLLSAFLAHFDTNGLGSFCCLTLSLIMSSPGFSSLCAAALSSGPPTPSKSLALYGLSKEVDGQSSAPLIVRKKRWSRSTHCPVFGLMPPSGISLFPPAPEAAEPYVT